VCSWFAGVKVISSGNPSHSVCRRKFRNHTEWGRFRSKVYPTRNLETHHQSGQKCPTRSKRSGRNCREFEFAFEEEVRGEKCQAAVEEFHTFQKQSHAHSSATKVSMPT
jgi:hypothetical protein